MKLCGKISLNRTQRNMYELSDVIKMNHLSLFYMPDIDKVSFSTFHENVSVRREGFFLKRERFLRLGYEEQAGQAFSAGGRPHRKASH